MVHDLPSDEHSSFSLTIKPIESQESGSSIYIPTYIGYVTESNPPPNENPNQKRSNCQHYPSSSKAWPELNDAESWGNLSTEHLLLHLCHIDVGEIGGKIREWRRRCGSLAPLAPCLVLLIIDHIVEIVGDVNAALGSFSDGDEAQIE